MSPRMTFLSVLYVLLFTACVDNSIEESLDVSKSKNGGISFTHTIQNNLFSTKTTSKGMNDNNKRLSTEWGELSADVSHIGTKNYILTKGNLTNLASMANMGVLTYYTQNNGFNSNTLSGSLPNFMYNTQVTKNENVWTYSPIIYWPITVTDSLSFFSYSPYSTVQNGLTVSSNAIKGKPYINYTMPSGVTNQPDLMISTPQLNKVKENGAINFQFKHALASIGFSLRGENDHVKTISITGFSVTGTLSMDGTAITWSSLGTVTTDKYDAGINYDLDLQYVTATATKVEESVLMKPDGYLMVIPQTLTTDTKIILTMEDNSTKEILISTLTPTWTAGNKYIYNILILPQDILIDDANTSNCYMIYSRPVQNTIFTFPAITRVNEFWGTQAQGGFGNANGDGYVALGNSSANAIADETTEWYAQIIWADFADYNKISIKQKNSTGSYGVGKSEKMQITFGKGSYSGNVLIGVKKKGGSSYLWSWHFWINTFGTTIGQVTLANGKTAMDRNLGALNNTAGNGGTVGLMYQWGRKDPFMGTSSLSSGIKRGLNTGTITTASNGTLLNCVYNPSTFYTANVAPKDAVQSGSLSGTSGYNRWGGATSHTVSTPTNNTKTIYDPCPTGWRVPSTNASFDWAGMTTGNLVWNGSNYGSKYSTSFFPAAGILDNTTGNLVNVSAQGNFWSGGTGLVSTTLVGYGLWFSTSVSVQNGRAMNRAQGAPIRPTN